MTAQYPRTLFAAALLLLPAAAAAQPSIVTADWLARHLDDPHVVVWHIGPKADYDAKHIPGARFVSYNGDLGAPKTGADAELALQMPAADLLSERLAGLGVSDGSQVVVYFSSGWVSPSTRAILTLRYAGFATAALLDGGLPAWEQAGQKVTADVPPARTGTLSPLKIAAPLVVDAEFVKARLKATGFAVVDARNKEFYDGTRSGGSPERPHKTGHIAGAVSVPFDSMFKDGIFKPARELAEIFAAAGVKPGATAIVYCHIGQQATAVIFGARLAGIDAVLYDGSFEDWSSKDLPTEKPGGVVR